MHQIANSKQEQDWLSKGKLRAKCDMCKRRKEDFSSFSVFMSLPQLYQKKHFIRNWKKDCVFMDTKKCGIASNSMARRFWENCVCY